MTLCPHPPGDGMKTEDCCACHEPLTEPAVVLICGWPNAGTHRYHDECVRVREDS